MKSSCCVRGKGILPTIRQKGSHPHSRIRCVDLLHAVWATITLQACHYHLYSALRSTFSWVRDNIALRVQEVPGQPLATALWPDLNLHPALELTAAVDAALADSDKLGDVAALLESSCGLPALDFAALVPDISDALQQLHADLPALQKTGEQIYHTRWTTHVQETSAGLKHLRQVVASDVVTSFGAPNHPQLAQAAGDAVADANTDADATYGSGAGRQRRGLTVATTTYMYNMPPSFTASAPAAMPAVLVPLIFHIMLYNDSTGTIGPANYTQAPFYVGRLVRLMNQMAKPTNFQFFIKVRSWW